MTQEQNKGTTYLSNLLTLGAEGNLFGMKTPGESVCEFIGEKFFTDMQQRTGTGAAWARKVLPAAINESVAKTAIAFDGHKGDIRQEVADRAACDFINGRDDRGEYYWAHIYQPGKTYYPQEKIAHAIHGWLLTATAADAALTAHGWRSVFA